MSHLFHIAGFSTPVQYKNKEEKLWKVSYKAWVDPYSYFIQKKNRHLSEGQCNNSTSNTKGKVKKDQILGYNRENKEYI
jgi:hypothetical protein